MVCGDLSLIRGADVIQGACSRRTFLQFALVEIPVPRNVRKKRINRIALITETLPVSCVTKHGCDQRPVLKRPLVGSCVEHTASGSVIAYKLSAVRRPASSLLIQGVSSDSTYGTCDLLILEFWLLKPLLQD